MRNGPGSHALPGKDAIAFLAAWLAAPCMCKNVENPLFFVWLKPYATVSRSARNNDILEAAHSKDRLKKQLSKEDARDQNT